MQVKDIMNTDVKTISPASTAQDAAKEMNKYGIGGLIVVDRDRMAGIVTERDIMRHVVAAGKDPKKVKTKEIMVKRVIMIDPEADIYEAAEIMQQNGIKKLPVLHKSSLVGIITATDIVAAQPKMIQDLSELFAMGKKKSQIVAG